MAYTALYRKFRPTVFADVKGQDHIVTTLKNQIKAGRIGHAYLFCGTRGTGKTTAAKIFARAVNCESPVDGSPCGTCAMCRRIADGSSMNVMEIDAASNNGVDNIRQIREEVTYRPAEGKYKVYIIDEVHMLSAGAFNALLKTLEEPPEYVIFILATTEVHKIPVTILSRCQQYDFHRISVDTIAGRLAQLMEEEKIEAEPRALSYVAKAADGSMRDALSLLDQCIAFYIGQPVTYEHVLEVLGAVDTEVFGRMIRMILAGDVNGVLLLVESLTWEGRELSQLCADFTWYLRNLLLAKTSDNIEEILDISAENMEQMAGEAKFIDAGTLLRYIRIFSELTGQMRYSTQKRVLFEVALIRLCVPAMETNSDALLDRIRAVENRLEDILSGALPAGGYAKSRSGGVSGGSDGGSLTGLDGLEGAGGPLTGGQVPEGGGGPDADKVVSSMSMELKEVVSRFRRIVREVSGPLGICLGKARLSAGDGDTLLIVASNELEADFLNQEKHLEAIRSMIKEETGQSVDIQIRAVESKSRFEDVFADIESKINMPIEEEDM